jgi:N-acetylmuramoyl-L-alanine amidase
MRWNRSASHRRVAYLLSATALYVSSAVSPRPMHAQNAPVAAPATNQAPAASPAAPAQHVLLIMIDAAHGGSEPGAALNAAIPEKDVTLAIARRLREQLAARGIPAELIRDNDATLSTDQRAQIVNAAHPELYIAIHATSQGTGMRIYSAMLPAGGDDSGPFVAWEAAQSSARSRSQWAQDQIATAIHKTGFPLRSLIAPLRPLNNVTVPALAIEIAPTTGNVSQLASVGYQQMVTAALANSIAAIRGKLETVP